MPRETPSPQLAVLTDADNARARIAGAVRRGREDRRAGVRRIHGGFSPDHTPE